MSKEERYMEWLEREEEVLGLGATGRVAEDMDYARALLEEELGYTPTDAQLDAFTNAAKDKYDWLPVAGVSVSSVERDWGTQVTYRDLTTGKFVSYDDVRSALDYLRGGK